MPQCSRFAFRSTAGLAAAVFSLMALAGFGPARAVGHVGDILRFTATEIQDIRIQLGALEKPAIDSPEAAWRTATFGGLV